MSSALLAGLRVLVVEDEAVVAEALRLRLRGLGCEVVGIADTGEMAVEEAVALRPGLVLMDVRLRGQLDGIEAGSWIREHLGVPVVYLSAHSDQATLTRAIAARPSGYLVKPHREAELVLALEIAIQQRLEVGTLEATRRQDLAEAALALQASESRWQFALDGAGDGVWDWDVPSGEVFFSRRFLEILGYAPGEIASAYAEWESRVHPDDVGPTLAKIEAHVAGRAADYVAEHRLRCKDGSYKWVLGRGRILTRGPDGAPLRFVGTLSDVSEAKAAQQALQESESRFRALVEDLDVGVVLQDADDRIVLSNPAAQRILGAGPDELDGNSSRDPRWELIRPDGTPLPIEEVPSVVAGRTLEPVRGSLLGSRSLATGERRWLFVTALPRLRADGSLVHVLVSIVDVTAQRELEEKVAQAQRLQAVGRLAGGVAHDFNNLCMISQNSCDLILADLEAGRLPDPEHARAILEATGRAADLTHQLLTFSRKAAVDPRPLDLCEIVASQCRLLRRVIPENIALVAPPCDGPLWIWADRSQIDRVVMNLCLNARDAMPDGGRLEIVCGRGRLPFGAAGEGHARLEVRDSGSGIEPSLRREIFEPFFTTKRAGKGTGLGLATVQSIVAGCGGVVEVESEVGRGSVFRVFLPLTDRRPQEPAGLVAEPPANTRRGSVLLVEDETALRRVLREALERAGFEVLEAVDGASALELWRGRGGSVDLLVTDLVMPGMGGRAVAATMRREKPEQAVLFMTGYEDSASGAPGVDTVLRKPFRTAELVSQVTDLLSREPRVEVAR